jgi:prophage tail gpP-like protein
MLTYEFFSALPTLVCAYRLYADAGRADELRAENKIIHPSIFTKRRKGAVGLMLAPTQPEFLGAKLSEIATLIVRNQRFTDWETVWVQHRWNDAYCYFRFTCAERDRPPALWTKLQFKPGDPCDIYLGNQLGCTGYIIVRQMAADPNSHGVSLQGYGKTWSAATSSIIHDTNNFEGPLMSIAAQLLAPTGVGLTSRGNVDGTPFKPAVHPNPGETIYKFLERLARDRDALVTYDVPGNVLIVGQHEPPVRPAVIEGENIKNMQVVISAETSRDEILATGQRQADDKTWGPDASEMRSSVAGDLPFYRKLLVPIEHPVWTKKEVDLRATFERRWAGMQIDADITVYGWFTTDGVLWKAGDQVTVESDMAMLHEPLSIQTVTFEQDSSQGTRTTLHLIEPWRNEQEGGIIAASGPTTPTQQTGLATAPPKQDVADPPPQFLPPG